MQAVVLTKYGSPQDLELREVDQPVPQTGEVLVEVHAAAVNDWEWGLVTAKPVYNRFFAGLLRPKVMILGCDVAGRVVHVGEGVDDLAVGDDVYGDLSSGGFGAFAEYVAAPSDSLRRMPRNLSYQEAATLPHAGGLAWGSLYRLGRVDRVCTLLLNGAGGGVGAIALQLAKRHGVDVTGVDSASKLEYLRVLGCDEVIDYTQHDFTKMGRRWDMVLDVKTTRSPWAHARALEPGGLYVTVGGTTPRLLQCVTVGWLMRREGRRVRLLGLKANEGLDELTTLAEGGVLAPSIDGVYPLTEVPDALDRFGAAEQRGKIVIRMR